MINTSNKKASGRNLLWRPIQGGHESHGKTSPEENFVHSEAILERFDETANQTFSDLPGRPDLAYQVSFHTGNRRSDWPKTSRQSPTVSQWFGPKKPVPSASQRESFGEKGQSTTGGGDGYRRYHMPPKRQKDRRFEHSSFGQRNGQGAMRCDLSVEDFRTVAVLGGWGLSSQEFLPQRRIQKQNSIGPRSSPQTSPKNSHLRDSADGQLVYVRSCPYSYYRSWMDICRCDQMQSDPGNRRQEDGRQSPGQGTEDLQNCLYFQEAKTQDCQAHRPSAQDRDCASVYYQRRRQGNPISDYQQSQDERIRNGQTLQPEIWDRNLPQGHQAALGLRPRVHALLARRPNTLDTCHDRLQLDCPVVSKISQRFSPEDSPFQKYRPDSKFA